MVWLGPTKLSVALGAECTHRGAMPTTAHRKTSPFITYDKLICLIFLILYFIPGWVKFAEPNKVRLDINFGVLEELMFMQPLLGPGC